MSNEKKGAGLTKTLTRCTKFKAGRTYTDCEDHYINTWPNKKYSVRWANLVGN